MVIFNNDTFKILWSFLDQEYTVYYKGKFFIRAFRYSDIRCYTS